MTPARQELRDLMAATMRDCLDDMAAEFLGENVLADALVKLFDSVEDEWQEIDISTVGDGPGGHVLDQRWLVARVPRHAKERERKADRTVRSAPA